MLIKKFLASFIILSALLCPSVYAQIKTCNQYVKNNTTYVECEDKIYVLKDEVDLLFNSKLSSDNRVKELENEVKNLKDSIGTKDDTIRKLDDSIRKLNEKLDTRDLDMQMRWWVQGSIIVFCGIVVGVALVYIPRPNRRKKRDRF